MGAGKRTLVSVLWAAMGRVGRAGGQIIFMVALGRAVGPAGFGAATIALIAYQLISTLSAQSFSQALVRYRDASPQLKASAFWLNMGLTCGVTAIITTLSPWISELMQLPELLWLIPALAVSGALAAPAVLAQAALSKEMRFKRIASIETIATLAGTLAGLLCLWMGLGLWGLVAFALVQRLAELVLFAWSHSLWPQERPSRDTSKDLLRFTAPLAGFQILSFMNGTVDQFFVGIASTAQSLGQFSIARRLTQQPTQMVSFAISRAMFPALVRAKEAGDSAQDLLLSALRLSLIVAGLPFALIAILSKDILLLVLGPDWLPAAPYLSLFAIVSSTMVMGAVLSATLQSEGKTGHQFLFQLSRIMIAVTLLFTITQRGGTTWDIAIAMSGITIVFLFPSAILVCRALRIPAAHFGKHILHGILPNIAACTIGYGMAITVLAESLPLTRICACTLACGVIWILMTLYIVPEARARLTITRSHR